MFVEDVLNLACGNRENDSRAKIEVERHALTDAINRLLALDMAELAATLKARMAERRRSTTEELRSKSRRIGEASQRIGPLEVWIGSRKEEREQARCAETRERVGRGTSIPRVACSIDPARTGGR